MPEVRWFVSMGAVTSMPPVMMVMRRANTRKSDLHSARPNDAILDVAPDAGENELLHFGYVLQLGARAKKGGGRELEGEVGVKGEVQCGVGVRV